MGSPHTCLPEAAVGAGHLRERGRVGSSSMNIDSQSFHTFGGLPIGHFHDLKVSMILKASFQNWLVSRVSVSGSMCQIISVMLVRLLYFQVFISEGVSNIGLFQN